MRTSSIGNLWVVVGIIAVGVIVSGCASVRPTAAAGPREVASGPRSTASDAAIAAVRSLPAFREARIACAKGHFEEAARILARAQTSPAMTQDQRAYCEYQRGICLARLAPPEGATHPIAHPLTASTAQSADCGPRALLIACRMLGVHASLPELTRSAATSSHGTTMAGLKHAAEALKLKVEGVQSGREALTDLTLPAIGWSHGNHYIAVLAWNGRGESGTATIQDPNSATPSIVSQEQLLQATGGYLLTLRR